jgi:hypothetical protein
LILEGTQKSMPCVGQSFNHGKGFQTEDGGGCLDQASPRHEFYFADELGSADLEETIRLIVRGI